MKKLLYINAVEHPDGRKEERGPFTTSEDARADRSAFYREHQGEEIYPTITEQRRLVETPGTQERHVYPTSELPHLWAHQAQADARNPQGNLFFEGPTIYSYRHSWPLATIHKHKKKGVLVLTDSDTYSNTTTQHQHAVRMACSHLTQIAVPCPLAQTPSMHQGNLDYFKKEINKLHDQAKRVLSVHAVEWRENNANELHDQERKYRAYFGIRTKQAPMPDFKPLIERARSIENPDPIRDAKRHRAKIAREKSNEKRAETFRADYLAKIAEARTLAAENVEKWKNGENVSLHVSHPNRWNLPNWQRLAIADIKDDLVQLPVMLRIKGDQIETSQGATIPLDHAPRIWKFVCRVMQSGTPYERNGHTEHAGHFPIDRVDIDGTLKAGCHTIPFSEIQRIADQLGLNVTA